MTAVITDQICVWIVIRTELRGVVEVVVVVGAAAADGRSNVVDCDVLRVRHGPLLVVVVKEDCVAVPRPRQCQRRSRATYGVPP